MVFEYLGSFLRFILGAFLKPLRRVSSSAALAPTEEEASAQPQATGSDDVAKESPEEEVVRATEADLVYAAEPPVAPVDEDAGAEVASAAVESSAKQLPAKATKDADDCVTFEVGPYKVRIDDIQVNLI